MNLNGFTKYIVNGDCVLSKWWWICNHIFSSQLLLARVQSRYFTQSREAVPCNFKSTSKATKDSLLTHNECVSDCEIYQINAYPIKSSKKVCLTPYICEMILFWQKWTLWTHLIVKQIKFIGKSTFNSPKIRQFLKQLLKNTKIFKTENCSGENDLLLRQMISFQRLHVDMDRYWNIHFMEIWEA